MQRAFDNNILFGAVSGSQLYFSECPSEGALAHFRNNAVLDHARMIYGIMVAPPCSTATLSGADTIEAELASHGVTADHNVVLRADCSGQASCISVPGCTNEQTCAAAIFESWTAADGGFTELMGKGWLLSTAVPCVVAQSSLDLGVTSDLFGALRTVPPSMGAHESDAGCR